MSRKLHIVCLDTPWPPDYGGAIDMMNRIIQFHRMGTGIYLHYFSYNERGTPNELNRYCEKIFIYERKEGSKGLSARLPYIVSSRINQKLIDALQNDDHPVLLEGIHCTGILSSLDLSKRKVVVRMHNDESIYYNELARAESSWLKKIFFRRESRLLRQYAATLPSGCFYACVSKEDVESFTKNYHLTNCGFVPTFPSWQEVKSEEGVGNLCLYHGNLSVPENEEAASWLLQKVFTIIRKPLVIAGKKPSRRLQKLAHLCQHTCLVADPSETEMNDLIRKAHINILPGFNRQVTGIRLKVLHALFEGRHCITHEAMVKGSGLEGLCHIGTNAQSFASIVAQLYHRPFGEEEIVLRKKVMGDTYDNEKNARKLIQYLW